MSQLTFDQMGEAPKPEEKETPRKETWYKGRVLSHSSISVYQACPQKWKFRYIDKIPQLPRPYFSFGKSVHTGLEFLFAKEKEPLPGLEEVISYYKEKWMREGYETAAQEKWFYQEGERILRGFYAKHQKDFEKVFHVEYKFTFDIEGVPMTGFIDRVDKTPSGKLGIVDYKTGKAFDKSRVRQDPQLTLYQMACRVLLGQEVETVTLYHLNSLTPLTVPAHGKALEETYVSSLLEAARGINENKFDARPDAKGHCQWCDYLQVCPAFIGKKIPASLSNADFHPMMETIDRYGKLDQKINELLIEKEKMEEQIMTHMDQTGVTTMKGQHFSVSRVANADDDVAVLEASPLNGDVK